MVAIMPMKSTKNRKGARQPIPSGTADLLRPWLAEQPEGKRLWPGLWYTKAAEMLRIDLDAANVPYIVQGDEGPLYADFHSLRHSYIAALDRAGATLKEAMQLARHSDPKLTMAVYGKARPETLAGRVEQLPDLHTVSGGQGAESAYTSLTQGVRRTVREREGSCTECHW